jgi:hypothetical protein
MERAIWFCRRPMAANIRRVLCSRQQDTEKRGEIGQAQHRQEQNVRKIISTFTVLLLVSGALAGPKGTVPRASADQYPVHAQENGISLGAKLLSREKARRTFVSDVNRCCMVLEVALYPGNASSLNVSLNDFALRSKNAVSATKPSSAKIVAASIQQKAAGDRDVAVYPSAGIGYESGTVYDPVTGAPRRAGGVYTQAGVGVAVGGSDGPGVSDKDRGVMETELREKGLPEGTTSIPVAGYIYFPVMPKKKGDYELEYVVEGIKLFVTVHVE